MIDFYNLLQLNGYLLQSKSAVFLTLTFWELVSLLPFKVIIHPFECGCYYIIWTGLLSFAKTHQWYPLGAGIQYGESRTIFKLNSPPWDFMSPILGVVCLAKWSVLNYLPASSSGSVPSLPLDIGWHINTSPSLGAYPSVLGTGERHQVVWGV